MRTRRGSVRAGPASARDVRMTANVRSVSMPETGRRRYMREERKCGWGGRVRRENTVAVKLAIALEKCGGRVGISTATAKGRTCSICGPQQLTPTAAHVHAEKYGIQVFRRFLTPMMACDLAGAMLHGEYSSFREGGGRTSTMIAICRRAPVSGLELSNVPVVVRSSSRRRSRCARDSRPRGGMYQKRISNDRVWRT